MNDDYTEALKEIATLAPVGVVMLETLSIWHAEAGAINLVNAPEDLVAWSDQAQTSQILFKASSFKLSLPESSMEGTQHLNLTVPNINRQASEFINRIPIATSLPANVTFRIYGSNISPMVPQNEPPIELSLTDIQVSLTSASARCSFRSVINMSFPNEYYTLTKFPSLGN